MEIYDQCLIRYLVEDGDTRGVEKTALIIQEGDIFKSYWPHLNLTQPDLEEYDAEDVEQYTFEGWTTDERLVAVHAPLQTREDVSMWLMLHPEDLNFIAQEYPDLVREENHG